uniref:Uncharacterized protein n=1 Tax=Oryza glumipatula TaxID=40148 RepID=A0A0D9ZAQ9_9ORYZ
MAVGHRQGKGGLEAGRIEGDGEVLQLWIDLLDLAPTYAICLVTIELVNDTPLLLCVSRNSKSFQFPLRKCCTGYQLFSSN